MKENVSYDELVQLKESGEIGWNEFVSRSNDGDAYQRWLDENNLESSDENAREFLRLMEKDLSRLSDLP